MTTRPAARIPLTVIGGFLGAGKTTLLNRWLREAKGRRMAVLVNDFGALNIDAALIEGASGDTIALTNGCVCCQIGDDLSRALIQVLEAPTPFDAVVIEASGVSDPWRIAQLGMAAPELALEGVIVLVDAGAVLAQVRDPLLTDTLERQVRAADLVVVNKTDRVGADELARVRDWVSATAGKTPRFETSQAQLPMVLLDGLSLAGARGTCAEPGCTHEDHADHSHAHAHDHGTLFDTWSCRPAQVFDAGTLRAWLRDAPAGLLRLKGLLRTGENEWSEVQFAGRHGMLRKANAPLDRAALVAIGLRGCLPVTALEAVFMRGTEANVQA
ncbi:CobW family GTP-binding protein [Variovorax sp. JS1663]|uniref:CobW family GTP-binding protein n=1 Tax=Variovorax sp. JS1663 TaxID=1851577 RepID=UPI000B342CA5|nr:GTP-binding protein [Variovorax sp. JS1663]OUL99996.1 cobalamin biosynthesis protein P47K [Variovorax sp. JS1663]